MTQFFTRQTARRSVLSATLAVAVGAAALAGLAPGAAAEEFPDKTINVVTHAGAGGGTDITTRMMMLRGRRVFKQDMAVVSKRGGSGSKALMYVNSQPRDGYTIMTITQSHLFQIAQGKVPLKIDDLVGLARATDDPQIVCVPGNSPIKTLEDLIAASKDKGKGGLKWGTTFVGGADHVAIHGFAKAAGGIPFTPVPFKGGGAIVTNLVGGNVEAALLNYKEGEAQFGTGEIRPVAVLAGERIESLPDTPTAKEKGIDSIASTVRGFAVLKGVPDDRMKVLEKGLLKAMSYSVYQDYLQGGGMPKNSVVGMDEWNKIIRRMYDESQTSLKELGLL
ncbi:MAG: tripartite tricarboxylate transporter substrate binding protein [Rhodospirillales bacterium]|nr:tripartite tricarboxylate transporter substrate binding protein [Rhodospirillales bacterium]MDH3790228.1 tripartite tricarboxylate transporter substrate binding protein [Rhodospirillales bacterium]MDH3910651.1 tripartite tricarboxylate transporter substrate binding protein [Rhodospirillales bacterium]MDH3918351.1 tripartite tricarboxylate transporter substrate binding protein [Rhodospirillales bacterium]MDH3965659.1 tripartite tricarboxylate transporter substrate binding protein [Rhodospiril